MQRDDLYAFLAGQRLAVVASLADGGQPEAALLGVAVTPELELVFDTVNTSRKYRNLRQNPKVAAVLGWADERTVQYEGVARELSGVELANYQAIYFAAFPEGRQRMTWPGLCYFCVEPHWVRYTDCIRNVVEEFYREPGQGLRRRP